ncbi:MAG: peptide chain release factor N(5)-glutamine methyltransferase [Lentisphaeria bacterium]|jgi:release factor glutamine methyltransferase
MTTIRQAWDETAAALAAAGAGPQARHEAAWLLEHLLGCTRAGLLRQTAQPLPPAAATRLCELRNRRCAGEPLQYLLGDVEFCGLRIEVGPGVLIPRPETEGLATLALAGSGAPDEPLLDLCTGSGAVAFALAQARPAAPVHAVELSPAALAWARRNRERLGLANVVLHEGDLFAPLPPGLRFRAITANPPYIPTAAYERLPVAVKGFEPRLALEAGADGLDLLRRIAAAAPARLLPGGRIICEIGSDQGAAASACLRTAGLGGVTLARDCYGAIRFVSGDAFQL